jgi:Ring finger domain
MNCSSVTLNGTKCKQKAVEDGKCRAHVANTCAVCLEQTKRTDKKLKCKHVFHNRCITTWFETSIECPTCRMEQDDDPLVVFRKHVEENMREKYRDAIRSLEVELARARRR